MSADCSLTDLLASFDTDDGDFLPPTNASQQLVTAFLDAPTRALDSTLLSESATAGRSEVCEQISQRDHDDVALVRVRMGVYNHELPFDASAQRRILKNVLYQEAFTATKGSDRLKAVELLGKTEGVSLFAPEKQVIEFKNAEELRARLTDKLGALLDGDFEDITHA